MLKTTNGRKCASERDTRAATRRQALEAQERAQKHRQEEQDVQDGGEGHSREEVARPTQLRRRRFILSSMDESINGEVSDDFYDVETRGRSRRRSPHGEKVSPLPGGGGRSRRIATGRVSPRRVRERSRPGELVDLEEEGSEGVIDEDNLRWELTRSRYGDRSQPREARRITGERRRDQEDVLAKTIRTMKRQLEDLREGNSFRKSEWKNRSNEYQFAHNGGVLKLLRRIKELLDEGVTDKMYEELDEAVAAGIKDVEERQKHLKIADRFGAKGWCVVDCYMS